MDKIMITYDRVGNTLDVWFGSPRPAICEETGGGVILKRDSKGRVIGFEKINYVKRKKKAREIISIPVEVTVI